MDFITIDFETATSQRNTPCEIGLTFVSNGKIADIKSWLIKPHTYPIFDAFNTRIHGISAEEVSAAPTFAELWPDLSSFISGNFLIAHNAAFDFSVLRNSLEFYRISIPDIKYACSYILAKQAWHNLPAYDLKTLCRINDIPLQHHRAAADSEATARLVLKAFESAGVRAIDDIPAMLNTTLGALRPEGHIPCSVRNQKSRKLEHVVGDPSKHNSESIFYGKTVVFTGTLSSMTRKDAQQLVADIGGINGNGVNSGTNFLVVGQQDFRIVGDLGISSKQKKAIDLVSKGATLEIIAEEDFLKCM